MSLCDLANPRPRIAQLCLCRCIRAPHHRGRPEGEHGDVVELGGLRLRSLHRKGLGHLMNQRTRQEDLEALGSCQVVEVVSEHIGCSLHVEVCKGPWRHPAMAQSRPQRCREPQLDRGRHLVLTMSGERCLDVSVGL